MDFIVINKFLEPQLNRPLQVKTLIILVLYLPPTIMQELSRQLFQLYEFNRRLFSNDVK